MNKPSPKLEAFMKEYGELVTKHGVDIATYPVFAPDGEGAFKLMIQSTPVDMEEVKKANEERKTLADFIPK